MSRPLHRHRCLVALLAGVSATSLLAACGTSATDPGTADGPITLTAVDYFVDDPLHTQWEEVLTECAEQAGVGLDHQSVPGDQLVPKVLQYASSRTMPDLLMLNNPDVQQIAATGALSPLSDYDQIDTSGFFDSILSAGTYEDQVYGLTPTVNAVALFYNEDLLEEAGVEPPRTWDELNEIAPALKTEDVYPISFSAANTFEGSSQFLHAFWSNGGNLNQLDSPEGVQALTYWSDLVKDGYASQSVLNFNQGDAADAFAAGKAAMTVNGPWNIPMFDETDDLEWAVAPLPTRTTEQPVVPSLGGETWTVPRTSPERQQKAAEVLACFTSPDVLMDQAKQTYNVPSRTEVAERYGREVPEMQPFVEEVKTARPRTEEVGGERYPAIGAALAKAVQAAASGSATPQEAMAEAQREAEAAR